MPENEDYSWVPPDLSEWFWKNPHDEWIFINFDYCRQSLRDLTYSNHPEDRRARINAGDRAAEYWQAKIEVLARESETDEFLEAVLKCDAIRAWRDRKPEENKDA